MPLPAGFTAQHYNDIPLFEVSASARARYRAYIEKAWSDTVTARAAFAAQSLSKEDTRYKVERMMAEIFGNIPETTFFGDSAYAYPTNEWDHISSISTTTGTANTEHIPENLVPFPFTAVNATLRLSTTDHRHTRIYNLNGLPAWPWTVGPALVDTSEVHIEWLVYQGETGTGEATQLKDELTCFAAGMRGHAVDLADNPFGVSEDDVYSVPAGLGGKLIRQNLVPDRVGDPRTLDDSIPDFVVTGNGGPVSPNGNYFDSGETNNSEPIYTREDGLFSIWLGASSWVLTETDSVAAPSIQPVLWAKGSLVGPDGTYDPNTGSGRITTGTATIAAGTGASPVVQYGIDHALAIRCQLQLNDSGPFLGVLGGRFVFGNKRGVGLEQFSAGGDLNDPVSWANRNADAIPYWAPIMGAPDVVIINYSRSSGTSNYDDLYDEINAVIDIWKQANPNVLIILASNRYSAGSPGTASAEYRTHYGSVYRQIALDRDDVMFFNQMRWLDNRANHTTRHSVGNLGGRDKGVWSSETTYDIGDVVQVTRETSSNSPEARGTTQYYICLSDGVTNQRPGIDAGGSGLQTRWALFNQMLNDDVHPSGELERHRCLSYAQLLSGTFPDRTANELLGLTGGGLGGRIWSPGTWANGTFAN